MTRFIFWIKNRPAAFILLALNLLYFFPVLFLGKILLEGNLLGLYYPWKAAGLTFAPPHNLLCSDGVFYFYPLYQFAVESIRSGDLGLWNPFIGSGVSLWGNAAFPFIYPGAVLFYLLPFKMAWNWTFFLHLLFAGFGMYAFLRLLKLSRFCSLTGAILYNFGGFAFTFVWIGEHIFPLTWTPWIIFFYEKFLRAGRGRYFILTVLALASQIAIGQTVFSFFLGVLFFCYFLFRACGRLLGKRDLRQFVFDLIAFGLMLAAVYAVSYCYLAAHREIVSSSSRGQNVMGMVTFADCYRPFWNALRFKLNTSATPWYFIISYVLPNFFGNSVNIPYWGDFQALHHNDYTSVGSHYLGILPLLVLVAGIGVAKRNPYGFFFYAMSVFILMANFLLPSPFFLMPASELILKYHNRLVFLLAFTLPVAAAFALKNLTEQKLADCHGRKQWWDGLYLVSVMAALLSCAVASGILFFPGRVPAIARYMGEILRGRPIAGDSFVSILKYEILYFAFFACMLAVSAKLMGSFAAGKIKGKRFKFLFILLIIGDLGVIGFPLYPRASAETIYPVTPGIKFLQKNIADKRMINYGDQEKIPGVFRANIPQVYGIKDAGFYIAFPVERNVDYLSLIPFIVRDSFSRFRAVRSEFYTTGINFLRDVRDLDSPLLDLLGVKYVVTIDDLAYIQKGDVRLLDELPSAQVMAPDSKYVLEKDNAIAGKIYRSLFQHAGSAVAFHVQIPSQGTLEFAISMTPESWQHQAVMQEDGVNFKILCRRKNSIGEIIFSKTIDPKKNPEERRWFEEKIDLSAYQGETVDLDFIVDPLQNPNHDFAVWGEPQIRSGPKQYPWPLVFDGDMKIYENRDVLPRAFTVNRFKSFQDRKALMEHLARGDFDPKNYVCLEGPVEKYQGLFKSDAPYVFSPAEVTSYGNNQVEVKVRLEEDAFLVLTENYFPGWKAYVDGKETEIFPAYLTFRSVFLAKGLHTVTFRYQPASFYKGAWISLGAWAVLVTGGILGGLVSKRRGHHAV